MKKIVVFLVAVCSVFAGINAQTWTAPQVPGIDEISVETDIQNTAAPVYNLQGIYMGTSIDDLPTGVYIQNGRKIYVK